MELIIGSLFVVFVVSITLLAVMLRRVVAPNEVHIVQSRKSTQSFGKDKENGNTYYEWPSWIPIIGIVKVVLPVSVFDISFNAYEAYDKGRVPFVVDIIAFFRIADSNLAAQRVQSFEELETQLHAIVKGAIRTVLASHDIDDIMVERSKYGEHFTTEVAEQLKNWGVVTVKNIELMDIRDATGNQVVHNIMEKKKSLIEMQSRTEVAANKKTAEVAEIEAEREVEVQKQVASQTVGLRNAEREKQVGIANQQAQQSIKEQEKLTKEKEMAVNKVAQVTQAEIDKNVNVVKAEQEKQTTILIAEGDLEGTKRKSEGITIEGQAKAEAEKAMQLAPVQAQITLAKEIGSNEGYQKYLITIRQVEAGQVVGVEQAKALEKANIKVIANTGDPISGVTKVMDLFSSKGGTSVGAMLEGLAQTDEGKALLGKIKPAANGVGHD